MTFVINTEEGGMVVSQNIWQEKQNYFGFEVIEIG